MIRANVVKSISLIVTALAFSACTNGGTLELQPGAVKVKNPGSPFVTINSGGKALVVQSGKTATTGVHGWVSVQPVSSQSMSSSSGVRAVIHEQQSTRR